MALTTTSCKQKNDYSWEFSRLDSASQALNFTQAGFRNFIRSDSSAIASGSMAASQSVLEITQLLSSDTINKNLAVFLSELSAIKESLTLIQENAPYYSQAIDTSIKQIHVLRTDLEKDLIEKNKALAYVVNEIAAATKLMHGLNQLTEKTRLALHKLDSLKPQIIVITDSLKSK